jgi:hypothetical protein
MPGNLHASGILRFHAGTTPGGDGVEHKKMPRTNPGHRGQPCTVDLSAHGLQAGNALLERWVRGEEFVRKTAADTEGRQGGGQA